MAKTKYKKIITAGRIRAEAVYSAVLARDGPEVRREKRRASSEARKRLNDRTSRQHLEYYLATNFVPGDLVVRFSYDDAHLPGKLDWPRKGPADFKAFRAKLNAARRARGQPPPVIFWVFESKHGDARPHIHAVITGTGDDIPELLECWGRGGVHVRPLRADREKNYGSLAAYLCKERAENSRQTWHHTTNAKRWEEETFRVEDDTPLNVPAGAVMLGKGEGATPWSEWRFVKYMWCGGGPKREVRAKRRRGARERGSPRAGC